VFERGGRGSPMAMAVATVVGANATSAGGARDVEAE
jgi:hypothetical protein